MKRKLTATQPALKRLISMIIMLFLGWRFVLGLVAAGADFFLLYEPSFPYYEFVLPKSGLPRSVYSWGNFDGVHYLLITEMGYDKLGLVQAFFPVYPLLIQALTLVGVPALVAGLTISNLFALILCVVWFGFMNDVYDRRIAWMSLAILLTFPTAFYFGAVYSESLFLTLVIGSFWAAHRQQWWLAASLAAVASATRVVGVILVPALMIELWQQTTGKDVVLTQLGKVLTSVRALVMKHWPHLMMISAGAIGLLAYMGYLWQKYHDPLYFMHVQKEFGAGRSDQLVLYPQVVWRSLKILITYRPFGLKYYAYAQEAVAGIGGLALLLVGVWPSWKIRWSWLFFSLVAFLVPTATGIFSSMPRYILVCFPIMIILALFLQKRPSWLAVYLIGSSLFLVFNTILFIQGYWVA